MIKIRKQPADATVRTFTADVKFKTINADGSYKPASYKAIFKYLDLPAYQDLVRRTGADGVDGDALVIEEVFVGWAEGVVDEQGQALEYSTETRDALMAEMGCRPATVKAFFDKLAGARTGN